MRGDRNRPHPGAAAAVRNRKRLVQVEVADVGADCRRAREPDLRVEVRAVHVDLAAVLVDDRADLANPPLEDAVRARVRDHQARQPIPMGGGFRAQVVHVDVAGAVGGDNHDLHPGHRRAGWIGPVRRLRNQRHDALRLALRGVIRVNHEQARELSLRAGIRLQRHGRETGQLGQTGLELAKHALIAGRLVERRERVLARELRPGHRHHLGGRVQLHRAGAERDHRRVEADVLVFEAPDVAHHLGFGVMRVEDRVREVPRPAPQPVRQRARIAGRGERDGLCGAGLGEHRNDLEHVRL